MILPLASKRGPVDGHANRDAAGSRIGHLAGHGPFPDQVVKPELVGAEHVAEVSGKAKGWPAGRMASWASCAFLTFVW